MRGMSLLQMVGGVAVAGAVAAGTTAFTAGGLSLSLTNATTRDNGFLGGNNNVTVAGATLSKLDFTQAADAGATAVNDVSMATLTFAVGIPDDATVTLTPVGGSLTAGTAGATGFHCSLPNSTTHVVTCPVSASSTTAAGSDSYWAGLTGVAINVS